MCYFFSEEKIKQQVTFTRKPRSKIKVTVQNSANKAKVQNWREREREREREEGVRCGRSRNPFS
jgi:hypothetical protein